MQINRIATLSVTALVAAGVVLFFATREKANGLEVTLPALSDAGERGQTAFATYCAECHGRSGGGTDKGPPLIHEIYHPGHHGDASIVSAVTRGSRAHHWPFGDMQPVEGVHEAEIRDIIAFVREVQRANGIF